MGAQRWRKTGKSTKVNRKRFKAITTFSLKIQFAFSHLHVWATRFYIEIHNCSYRCIQLFLAMDPERLSTAATVDAFFELSQLLDCGIDRRTVQVLMALIEAGVNPFALVCPPQFILTMFRIYNYDPLKSLHRHLLSRICGKKRPVCVNRAIRLQYPLNVLNEVDTCRSSQERPVLRPAIPSCVT